MNSGERIFEEPTGLCKSSPALLDIKTGDIVECVIVHIGQDEVLLEIGQKLEGVPSYRELLEAGAWSFDNLHLNGKVPVYVIHPGTLEAHTLLSLKRGIMARSGSQLMNTISMEIFSRHGPLTPIKAASWLIFMVFKDLYLSPI